MGAPTDETLPSGATDDAGAVERFAVGSIVAERYRIERFIASGGMGEVYAAHDLVLDAKVALKTLRAELEGSADAIARLRREIALARTVSDPHICRLHDVGQHEGRVFLSMELLQGRTLAELVTAQGLPLADVDRIAAQLIAGLAVLHRASIIHRDFKTANVIVVGDGDDTRAVITDFGLARSVDAGDARLTVDSGLVGTPAYMAPEQVEARPATKASDIYALGVVLFELLTGKLPFDEDTAMATAIARLTKDPPKPSSLRAEIPARWDAIVRRCLERDPALRPWRVEDVLGATARRRWVLPLAIGAGAAVVATAAAIVVLRDGDSHEAPVVDPGCPSAVAKVAGVWDPITRTAIGVRFEGSGKPFVIDMWHTHARQFDDVVTGWAQRWDAACTSSDRTSDPLLYGQRLACLEARLVEVTAQIDGFSDLSISVEDLSRASPGQFPIDNIQDCDNAAVLRTQGPPPPVENRAEVARLMAEGAALRVKLRHPVLAGGLEAHARDEIFERVAAVEQRLIELSYPAGAGELRYWRGMYLMNADKVADANAALASLIELAEQTRDDYLLVTAITDQVRRNGYFATRYDVAAAEATLARAEALAKRIGNPPALLFDIAEARTAHAFRVGAYAEWRHAMQAQIDIAPLMHVPSGAAWVEITLASVENDAAAARRILAEHAALLGRSHLMLGRDYVDLTLVLARGGDLPGAREAARRGIEIMEAGRAHPATSFEIDAYTNAAAIAIREGKPDEATAHVKAAVAAAGERGTPPLAAYVEIVTALARAGELLAARHAIELARGIAGSAADQAALAQAELEIRFDAREPLELATWAPRLTALSDANGHAALALVYARGRRAHEALAQIDAMPGSTAKHIARARVFAELGRPREVVAELAPFADTVEPGDTLERGSHIGSRVQLNALLGIAHATTGAYRDALAPLERGSRTRTVLAHRARFALARSLVETGGDRVRAKALAAQARTAFESMQLPHDADEVAAWIAAQH